MTADPIRIRFVECGKLFTWLDEQLGPRMTVQAVRSLHGGESPWWIEVAGTGGPLVLRAPSSRISAEQIATNVAALDVAARHGLPAPRLVAADPDLPASLETVVPGTSVWPALPSTELLLAAGAAIARVHAVRLAPQPGLPFRGRPIAVDDFARDRRDGRLPTTPILQAADDRVRAMGAPSGPVGFVHGDVWPGNTVLAGARVTALIDWKTAGVGHPGVDLGELRKQVAIYYDDDAPGQVLEGWERASGRRAGDVAYWDAVAALNTPTELYSARATRRRDEFLGAAISR